MTVHTLQSTKDSSPCCCRCPWINRDITCIVLLGLVIVLYMVFGAAVFSALERPSELKAQKIWGEKLANFAQKHSVSPEDLHVLLKDYEEANNAGVWVQGQRTFWDFPRAFYFVAAAVSTIGYGLAAPATTDGKIFLIFFGLIGCAATILLFTLFLERATTLIAYVLRICHEHKLENNRKRTATSYLTTQPGGPATGQNSWKPSVCHVTLILMVICFVIACVASGLYSVVEGWSFLETTYFCFVTFSTMGFGDMVSGQRERFEASWCYQIINILLLFLGLCCTYYLFNLIAIMIKAMLNWILRKILCLNCCSGAVLKKPQPVQLCCSCFMCPKVEQSSPRQLPITASCFRQHCSSHAVKLSTRKYRHPDSALQTVCQSEMHVKEKNCNCEHKMSNDKGTENSLHANVSCQLCQHNCVLEVMGGVAMLHNYLQELSFK